MLIGADLESTSGAPTETSINSWATTYGLTHPLVLDGAQTQGPYCVLGLPTYVVIDRDMTIVNADLWPFDPNFVIGLL